ncbi:glycoside hydrolase family 99-like domain-containing protein [Flavobacterium sp. '19STA2R22 D10 B1']|uniref:glycosyltransferase WbsX family protein n=1 Tax=Flavobacterium aerium TaxID=3037261 RepID=UPI00278BB70F|nr:glycoside hydrolase family 99-like domain-containing protein [Flavobacterium sp. '19STA2R22 D10 B1']
MKINARVIAFYLPQFHPIKENDQWWGKGFTEWTNVGKAKSLFKGHDQPRVPADLGYYDLRVSQTRIDQADMAREHGIEGFCYWHYWFGNGKRLIEQPFNEVVSLGEPDFPFCLAWANDSWEAKLWNSEGTSENKILQEQLYLGKEDYTLHFNELLSAFKDKRYIRVNNKPLFMIYKPLEFPDVSDFIKLWQDLAKENGLDGIHFIGQTANVKKIDEILSKGFDAVNVVRLTDYMKSGRSFKTKVLDKLKRKLFSLPFVFEYKHVMKKFVGDEEKTVNVIPSIIPNWDHTPRSGLGGQVFINSTPDLFGQHVKDVLNKIKDKPEEERITFIKSWNEWGEGNYMEPDLKYGLGYLKELKRVLEALKK